MQGSGNSDCLQSIPSTGLTVVVNPDEPAVDIIFVHGFTGHPERTWTHKRGDTNGRTDDEHDEPPSKMRKLNLFSKSNRESSKASVYWPRDLIPTTVPDARVLTFGYDTHIRHVLGPSGSKNTVYDIAWDFLVALEAKRREEPLRPILFVVHSLGGIVVKEMLRRSSGCRRGQVHLQDTFKSTSGIIFFGTPHGGADPRGILQHVAEKVVKIMGFSVNDQIVNTLLPSAERLRELRDEFGPTILEQEWAIHSFQEQLGVSALSGHKVVEDTSSCLNLQAVEVTEHIGRNHMDMCRFTGPNDSEYAKVASALLRLIKSISAHSRKGKDLSLSGEQKDILLDSLRFEQLNLRQAAIKKAHGRTCKWLLKNPDWLNWLDETKFSEHHGFMWIKGNPGTGKSTLMKFALDYARKQRKDWNVISFFFNARGDELEKTTLGTYRSLLLQLLEKFSALQNVFDSLDISVTTTTSSHQWSVESLKGLLEQAIQLLGSSPVVCFIDALDECDDHQILDMVSFFEHVGELAVTNNIKFHVCFSSRHYPYIRIRKGQSLILEGQEGHNQDISNFLNSELAIGHSKLAEEIRTELQTKASGIFMWVVLVVGILNKEYGNGRIHALKQKLREIPRDLHELFRSILTRNSDNSDELILCIQWVLFSKQPLRPEELYFAIRSGVEIGAILQWDPDIFTKDDLKRFILNASRGLTEITASRVQFIHESVRDFLLKDNGLATIWPELGLNFEGQSHQKLKQCCLSYVRIDKSAHSEFSKGLHKASSKEAAAQRDSVSDAFPFLDYAVRSVLYHADAAAQYGITQEDIIDGFPLKSWVKLNNLFETAQVRRYSKDVTLLYVLAERNLSALIEAHPAILSCFDVGKERYGPPFLASLATGSKQATETFARACTLNQSPEGLLHLICSQYCWREVSTIGFKRDFKFPSWRTALSYLTEFQHHDIIALALATERVDINSKEGRYEQTPLMLAIWNGDKDVVQMLLATGKVDVGSKDSNERTLLSIAAERGGVEIVEMLLATGMADIDSKDLNGRSPLSWAAIMGEEEVAKLLVATGKVDVDSKDKDGQTPLLWAAAKGNEAMVELLLSTGKVDVESKDKSGMTPVWLAVRNQDRVVVELLLSTSKVNVESKNIFGQTLLLWAAERGHKMITKLLLTTRKTDVNSKDMNERTPLHLAAGRGHKEVAELLLATGKVDVNFKDRYGDTPLSKAAGNGREAVVELLLKTDKVDVNSKDMFELTPLYFAAMGGYKPVVEMLLATGKADVESKNAYGQTLLSWAAQRGHKVAVELLLATEKTDVNSKDVDSRTPLSWAAKNGQKEVVELLLATEKTDVDSKDVDSQTPLSWAAKNGKKEVVELLLATGKVDVDSKNKYGQTPLTHAMRNERGAIIKLLRSHAEGQKRAHQDLVMS